MLRWFRSMLAQGWWNLSQLWVSQNLEKSQLFIAFKRSKKIALEGLENGRFRAEKAKCPGINAHICMMEIFLYFSRHHESGWWVWYVCHRMHLRAQFWGSKSFRNCIWISIIDILNLHFNYSISFFWSRISIYSKKEHTQLSNLMV